MRISDWSSDVCSSDLIGGVLPVELGAVPRRRARSDVTLGFGHREIRLAQHRVRIGLVWAGVQSRRGVGNARNIHVPPRRAVLEIGRASWRERVCRYV